MCDKEDYLMAWKITEIKVFRDRFFSAFLYKSSFTISSIVQNPPIPTMGFFLCAERRYRVIRNLHSLRPAWTSQFSISIKKKVIVPYEFALIDESV